MFSAKTFVRESFISFDILKVRGGPLVKMEFQIFNQWGNLVFETSDPAIKWNGSSLAGKPLSDGTYYYSCKVFENRVTGVTESKNTLSGFIHLIRN